LPFSSRYSTRSARTPDFLPCDVVFPGFFHAGWNADVRKLRIDEHLFILTGFRRDGIFAVIGRRHVVRRRDGIVFTGFVDLNRFAIELGVSEMVGRFAKVHDGEVILLCVLMDAGATPHDLLELGHRAHFPIERDEAAGLGIDSGGEQP
jgi:hypothetical protein